ncbi:hypothetical protein [Halocynthiibacter sp.]
MKDVDPGKSEAYAARACSLAPGYCPEGIAPETIEDEADKPWYYYFLNP